jgi:excisionase family DNA binding protein
MQNETTIISPSEYLTVAQLAKRLQISESTIYGWVERDYIPYLMAGDLLRFDPTVINTWMIDQANRKREKKRQLHARVLK